MKLNCKRSRKTLMSPLQPVQSPSAPQRWRRWRQSCWPSWFCCTTAWRGRRCGRSRTRCWTSSSWPLVSHYPRFKDRNLATFWPTWKSLTNIKVVPLVRGCEQSWARLLSAGHRESVALILGRLLATAAGFPRETVNWPNRVETRRRPEQAL